jgi:hypothetical protein
MHDQPYLQHLEVHQIAEIGWKSAFDCIAIQRAANSFTIVLSWSEHTEGYQVGDYNCGWILVDQGTSWITKKNGAYQDYKLHFNTYQSYKKLQINA